jgi:hypothetical protein
MAGLSAGRTEDDRKLGFVESITRVTSGNIGEGILAMASGQAAAACSMWLIESRPGSFPYDTLHTFRYFIGHPIPRIIWENKPMALGWVMPEQGNVRGRSKGFNFGPGLMGHVWNDNPWISLIPYAFGLAFLMRFMDQVVRLNPSNPFLVIPLGCALGDILGLARGETGLFLSRSVLMMTFSWAGMGFCAAILGAMGLRTPAAGSEQPTGETAPDELGYSDDTRTIVSQEYDADLAIAYEHSDAAIRD